MFEDKFFIHRKFVPEKLINYGFTEKDGGFEYAVSVMDGQFTLYVYVTGGVVSTKMVESGSGEEYTLHKVASSAGAYVGQVRAACEDVLTEISEKCCEPDIFHGQQTLAVIEYVRKRYGGELEFLWEKFPDNAIWRRADNRKWYGLIVALPKRKLGLDSAEIAEIIDLRLKPEQMAKTVDGERYFTGWHMNKKSWYTMILDGSVPNEEIFQRIDESYILAGK
ncbi:MAG: MmcQ/YjbR family DNA-binding protein [Eubacterium sp.]|nr:MmcQ/YjbR family DNA-binding protein [Eubacterium sp.]